MKRSDDFLSMYTKYIFSHPEINNLILVHIYLKIIKHKEKSWKIFIPRNNYEKSNYTEVDIGWQFLE